MSQWLRDELKNLTFRHREPCVSIFLPTHNGREKFEPAPIRLKTLIREAEERLAMSGTESQEARELLEPARKLVDDRFFWHHPANGLALFLAPEVACHYRLPIPVPDLVVVTHRFHLKPLLPLLSGDGEFYLLALSQNAVRLMHGTRFNVEAVNVASLPQSLADALKYDDVEKQLQMHSSAPADHGKGVIFHGHSIADAGDERIFRYFRQIDIGLRELLNDQRAPLVLAGVEFLMPIYESANTYPHLLREAIPGNPESLKAEDLHRRAWAIVEPIFVRAQAEAADQYRELEGTGRTANRIEQIVPASYHAQIDTLFVALGQQQWGSFDPQSGGIALTAEEGPGTEDLFDYAAIQTFLSGGVVYAVRREVVPGGASAAAILRW